MQVRAISEKCYSSGGALISFHVVSFFVFSCFFLWGGILGFGPDASRSAIILNFLKGRGGERILTI